MTTILDRIVARKWTEIDAARERVSEADLRLRLADAPPVRDFFHPLAQPGPMHLIAEVKKASPSRGLIRADFDPVRLASEYELGGADCISMLTDAHFFQGELDYLTQARHVLARPILRKDFLVDVYQVVEARVAGADAVLLIAECLEQCHLQKLYRETLDLGMTPLVEIHDPDNLPRVLDTGATLIGVNNRDLRTFEVDLDHTLRLRERIPPHCVLVGESGIHTHSDVMRLKAGGVDAILVGESLMSQPDVTRAVRRLMQGDASEA